MRYQLAEIQDRYPRIDVLPSRLFVDDGDVLTSAGVPLVSTCPSTSSGATSAPQLPTHGPAASWLRHSVRRASAVHRTAHARGEWRPTRPTSRLDARKPCTSARPRNPRDAGT